MVGAITLFKTPLSQSGVLELLKITRSDLEYVLNEPQSVMGRRDALRFDH